jgi:hypothetical protein
MEGRLKELMAEAEQALAVFADEAIGDHRAKAELAVQMLLSHMEKVTKLVKAVSWPHKLPVHLHGYTLRYPEDCQAGYQLDDDYITRQQTAQHDSYAQYLIDAKKTIEPKFLHDAIWDSSSNCSDQGLAIFNNEDFTGGNWEY